MLALTTGTPGAGKTLWTIAHVEALRQREGRDVWYWNSRDLSLPWKPLTDPTKWHECPPGSIIVIDEAQDVFPARATGQKVPEHVERMAKHRHQGFDVFLISQHPMKLDTNIRKDVEEHRHLMRKFGSHWSTVHLWKGVRESCEKSRKDSIASQWRFPKKVFEWYKSAEVHTHKRTIPWKLVAPFLLAPPLVIYAGWRVFYGHEQQKPAPAAKAPAAAPAPSSSLLGGAFSPSSGAKPPPMTSAEYAAAQIPRIEGLQHTAPVYDALTTPKQVPVPAACIDWPGKGCKCFTQAATPYAMPESMCKQIVAGGIFLPFVEAPKPVPVPAPAASAPAPIQPAAPVFVHVAPPTGLPGASAAQEQAAADQDVLRQHFRRPTRAGAL